MAPGQPTVQPAGKRSGYGQLRRSLGFTDLLSYGLIYMVPIAPFGIFGSVYASSGGMVALAYAIGMVALLFTASSYAQMSRAFPSAGSVYTYAGRGIAPPVGFLTGWAILLDYLLVPALLYLVAGSAMRSILHGTPVLGDLPIWAWVLVFLAFNTTVNYLGIRLTALVTRLLLIGELVVLAIFLAIGFWALSGGRGRGFSLETIYHTVYNAHTFSWPLIFGAASVAVLSFLGFDGIAMLAEENRDEARKIGRSMFFALVLAGVLFIVQTWVASMFVTDPAALISKGDPNGTAFYQAAQTAGGHWLAVTTAATTAIAWGFADSMAAQVAVARLLYAMARDRQLPKFLAHISRTRCTPSAAIGVVAPITFAVGLYMSFRADGIAVLSTLINFGAMIAFLALHVSVVWYFIVRRRSRKLFRHLVVPTIGFGIMLYVVINARLAAQQIGLVWLGIGVLVLGVLSLARRRTRRRAVRLEAAVEAMEKAEA